jgi:hypothetical protein
MLQRLFLVNLVEGVANDSVEYFKVVHFIDGEIVVTKSLELT